MLKVQSFLTKYCVDVADILCFSCQCLKAYSFCDSWSNANKWQQPAILLLTASVKGFYEAITLQLNIKMLNKVRAQAATVCSPMLQYVLITQMLDLI